MPDLKTCLRGEYENRIFQESNVEKIFEVFASIYRDKAIYMNYCDLLRSICPFNYTTKSKEEIAEVAEKMKPNSVLRMFDLDGSGDISIEEYVFFLTMYYMRDFQISKYCKNDQIRKEDFITFYRKTQSRFNLNLMPQNILDSRSVKVDNGILQNEEKVIQVIFGDQATVPCKKIHDLKTKINYEIDYFKVRS